MICPGNWNPLQNCGECLNHWDPQVNCEACSSNWDQNTNCTACLPHWYGDNCETCRIHVNLETVASMEDQDGFSWDSAFKDINSGIEAAGDMLETSQFDDSICEVSVGEHATRTWAISPGPSFL